MKNLKLGLITTLLLLSVTVMAQEKQRNGGQQRSPEDQTKNRIERLDKELKLSQNQKDSIYIYALGLSKKQQGIFKNTTDRKAAFENIKTIRQTTDTKIKSFLNPEQSKSYDRMQEEMEQRKQQRQKTID